MLKMRKTTPNNKKGYILRLRQSRTFKGISMTLALSLIFEMIQPSVSWALTEGPSQPEVQSFEPIGTTQMVDLFTGDFNYNIPLFNLPGPNGGYPVNLAYHAGVSMDDEASWVGLGWNLNVGALVRNMRGLPDEFQSTANSDGDWTGGDYIETKTDMKESWTLGASFGKSYELLGADLLKGGLNVSLSYNNYRGMGASVGYSFLPTEMSYSPFSYGLSLDSDNGLGVSASINLTQNSRDAINDFKTGLSFNGDVSLSFGMTRKNGESGRFKYNSDIRKSQIGSSISFARNNFILSTSNRVNTYSISASLGLGGSGTGNWNGTNIGLFFNTQDYNSIDKTGRKRPVVGFHKEGVIANVDYFTKDFARINDGQITKESIMLPHSHHTFDSYSSSGQGLNGYFRGRRNDIGRFNDPKLRNNSLGVSVDFEFEDILQTTEVIVEPILSPFGEEIVPAIVHVVNPASTHLGVGGAISFGWDDQRPWDRKNEMNFDFLDPNPLGINENHYYQAHGEQTIFDPTELSYMNGTDLALVTFEPKNTTVFTGGKRKILASENQHIKEKRKEEDGRVVRNTLIHTLENHEVSNLGEFMVPHYDYELNSSLNFYQNPNVSSLNRIGRKPTPESNEVDIDKHNAGFKVLNEDGSYYVYALPAYNNKEVENLFSVETPEDPNDHLYHNQVNTVDIEENANGDEVDYKKSGTHKFISKTTKSPYAHSYMLTSVQGADYVDIKNDGPTDDDLGYWVKFDYVKYGDNIKWRAPFHGANYSQGQTYTGQDDKGSYQYGEKEQWYLARMETKSHIAIFEMSERNDMKEAAGEFANSSMGSKSGLKIDKIKIYEKSSFDPTNSSNNTPLQTVHFVYDYSLCQGVLNNDNLSPINPAGNVLSGQNQGGKLTLKKVYFTSLNSTRGASSPYEFGYTSVATPSNYNSALLAGGAHDLVNPDYQQNAYDPWGGFKQYKTWAPSTDGTYDGGYQQHSNFPYVAQTSQGWEQQWSSLYPDQEETQANKELTQQANDLIASTWSLREIKLPSGGKINIEYESDDYSHVQHKVANQMFKIVKVGTETNPNDRLYNDPSENGLYFNDQSSLDEDRRRIYFKLEEPLKVGLTQGNYADSIYDKYVEPIMKDESGKRNLYFKSRMRLTNNSNNKVYEYIRGYLPLESQKVKNQGSETAYNYGVLTSSGSTGLTTTVQDGTDNYYTIGYVTIEPGQKKNGDFFDQYHPMALAAWTYMQTNAQELLNPSSSFNSLSEPSNTGEVLGLFTNILNAVPSTAASFGLIRKYCKGKNFAQYIDLANSGIRLASPDRKKYGGGHRVKQITISDEWASDTPENSREYGQVYDYTTKEDGMIMSSGVAQYEPQAGGDENALKYPIYFYGKNKMFTNNNLFAEAPINEALFPGAMVGYRKVTVRSLNTSDQMRKAAADPVGSLGTARGRTGGISVHEFYTSKEFPTMVEWSTLSEDNHTKDVFNLPIPIPFIGSIKRNYYHGSQAFKIETNDMHGKPKSVKAFELNEYKRNAAPITESVFEYQSKPIVYQGEQVRQLVSEVKVLPNDGAQNLGETNWDTAIMGVETDLFTDQRENKSLSTTVGLDFNADVLPFFFGLTFWPSFSNHKTMFRTYVTNKVVHRSGILKKTKTRDLQTVNESEVLAYDEKAGTPLVSRVKNEFGDYFYSYNIPAYYHYDRMGHAYQNINYNFTAQVKEIEVNSGENGGEYIYFTPGSTIFGSVFDHLVRGDEVLVQGLFNNPRGEYVSGTNPIYLTFGGVPADNNSTKKAYFLGFEYDASGKTRGILHFPDPVGVNDFPQSYGGYTSDISTMIDAYLKLKVIRSGRRNHYGSMAENYLSKGELPEVDVNTPKTNLGSVDGYQNKTVNLPAEQVLSATASLFKDDWNKNINLSMSYPEGEQEFVSVGASNIDNPFLTGNSGIWRPFKSYTYVGDRKSSASMTNNTGSPALKEDGVFVDEVPMFSYDLGNIEEYNLDWEWVNEVTRFSPDSYEVENKNRLGIYSSALYGYDNSLTLAVGGNASYFELGAMDFETSEENWEYGKSLIQTNMSFYRGQSDISQFYTSDVFGIRSATYDGSTMTVVTDVLLADFNTSNYDPIVGLSLNRSRNLAYSGNDNCYVNGVANFSSVTGSTDPVSQLTYAQFTISDVFITSPSQQVLPSTTSYTGKVRVLVQRPVSISNTTDNVVFTDAKAHTGKKCMQISNTALFDQPQLKMIKDKRYVMSLWVSKTDTKVPTFEPGKFGNSTNELIALTSSNSALTVHSKTYSKVVEGWQKIDFEISSSQSNDMLVLTFLPNGGQRIYIDDIRFSPKTGGITTYVYDPSRFWLRASLNVDNYATFFYYDEEGNLTIKKQETEEGIFTITESRGHVSEQN